MQYDQVNRRDFITLLGGAAAAWPLAARAQQPAMPVIGFLHPSSTDTARLRAFRQGLKDAGFVEGENVAIEYRWAGDQADRLPALAAELVQRRVAVIAAIGGIPSAFAAKAATTTIPIVFLVGIDPVRLGLVASLARPGGNMTGINAFATELASKRLELLHELVPAAIRIAVLVDPTNAAGTDSTLRDVGAAARAMGLQIQILNASTSLELDAAFATLVSERSDALFVGSTPFLFDRRVGSFVKAADANGDPEWRVSTDYLLTDVLSLPKERQNNNHTKRLASTMRRLGWTRSEETLRFGKVVKRGFTRKGNVTGDVAM
jgi:putative tryptophan/tyrosine transport system substrate-binding protein